MTSTNSPTGIGKTYGVAVMDEIEKQTGRSLNISSVHAVLQRLEDKGLVKSEMSEPNGERAAGENRIFFQTAAGKRSLEAANELRNRLLSRSESCIAVYKRCNSNLTIWELFLLKSGERMYLFLAVLR